MNLPPPPKFQTSQFTIKHHRGLRIIWWVVVAGSVLLMLAGLIFGGHPKYQ